MGDSGGKGAGKKLEGMASQMFSETGALRGDVIGMFEEIMRTGGAQTISPIVGRAVESSRRAGSQAMAGTEANLLRQGMGADSPFFQQILANVGRESELATSQIPTDFAQQFLSMIPGFTQGAAQMGMQGMGAAGQTQAAGKSATMQAISSFMPDVSYAI